MMICITNNETKLQKPRYQIDDVFDSIKTQLLFLNKNWVFSRQVYEQFGIKESMSICTNNINHHYDQGPVKRSGGEPWFWPWSSMVAMMLAGWLEGDVSASATGRRWSDWPADGLFTGESSGLPSRVLVAPGSGFPSFFLFWAFKCHFFRAFDVCSSKIALFMVDPIWRKHKICP